MLSMDMFVTIYAGAMGVIVGSFLNVCVYRIPIGISVAAGRSFCPACKHTLAWHDLVPVLSWLCLGGRCRYCKARISPRYPLVELASGALWTVIYLRFGWQWHTLFLLVLACALLVAALIDHDTRLVPNGLVLFLAPLGILEALLQPGVLTVWQRVGGLLCLSAPMLLFALWKNAFGSGDIKLCAVCGFFLGWRLVLLAALLAFFTGCVHGLWLIGAKRAGRKTPLPFVPHLAFGFMAAALWGEQLWSMYAGLWGFP